MRRLDGIALLSLALGLAALAMPLGSAHWTGWPLALWLLTLLATVALLTPLRPSGAERSGEVGRRHRLADALESPTSPRLCAPRGGERPSFSAMVAFLGSLAGAAALYLLLDRGASGLAAAGLWVGLMAVALIVWRALERAAVLRGSRALDIAIPLLFGVWLIYLWQVLAEGFAIPVVLLPPPSRIAVVLVSSLPILGQDFVQTFIKSMVPGYVIGCGAGFLTGVLIDRSPFLQRGLLPIGNLVSALPIVAVAPIMVMWFGFDWPSKAAVVVIMTFFPMLVNTIAGLGALGRIERDLLRTYAASYGQSLRYARLQAALPFIFNALKVNSTLALIGAIVAEFFGTPIMGMGFRISASVGRMDIPLVWATIAVAALSGSAAYGGLALLERRLTFWHPSFRKVS
jgi:NitT/TauT family transport system permease protein